MTPSPTKIPNLQHIEESSIRPEPKRAPISNTTEKLHRHQKYKADIPPSGFKSARRFQTLFSEPNPTQKTQGTTPVESKKNLVQLIANNFGNVPKRTTVPIFEYSTRRNFIGLNEMQVAAETASFARNQNRQYLQDYNKTYRPYPVYTPNLTSAPEKTKANSNLTTLYNLRDKYLPETTIKPTTKPVTSAPYSKSYTEINYKQEPYTRPGISSLKEFLEKEKNKTLGKPTQTEKFVEAFTTTSKPNIEPEDKKLTIETKNSFESVTKIPDVTREDDDYIESSSSDRVNSYTTNFVPEATEPSYQERRERLISKLNFQAYGPTEPTFKATLTEKYYGNLSNRPGLIVPPSLTPKTLHSLAIYYATGLDNFATTATPEDDESTTTTFDEYDAVEDGLPELFSQHTVNKYSSLFAHGTNDVDLRENMKLDPNSTYNELVDDLSTQMSQNPLATSPQIRELAQVFTHALSAYLQDPVQFRKVLSDIRPTPPNFRDMLTTDELLYNTEATTTVNEDDQEILGFSDEHKVKAPSVSLRQGKAIKTNAELTTINYPTTTSIPTTTDIETTSSITTTIRTPFRCCGRISASYTTAAPSKEPFTTSSPFTNTAAVHINTLSNKLEENIVSTTEGNDRMQRFGGFQNNKYQENGKNTESFDDYAEITKLPSAWGIDATLAPTTKGNIFESKRIRYTGVFPETTPVYFTETENFELDNEEELQRAHSQSFIAPQSNNIRQGKQLSFETKGNVKKPSENLEAPTQSSIETTTLPTTTDSTTTLKDQPESLPTISSISNIFTSPDSDRTTYQLPTTYENWQSTIMLDPITLNDGLSLTGADHNETDHEQQTSSWSLTTVTTQEPEYTETSEPSTTAIGLATLSGRTQERYGRLLKDSTTNTPQEITTDTVVEQAKEIMGGMNATTTEKLMNVMMKTKSKTVKRLILLLIQTCDDDHNSTAEASKKALLEALMAVSKKDMEEVAKEQAATESPTTTPEYDYVKTTLFRRRMDSYPENIESDRRGKSLKFDASAINSLSQSTTESFKTDETETPTTAIPTTVGVPKINKRIATKTIENANYPTNSPSAQARVALQPVNGKGTSDTRALELLRSLYTIAARWG